LIVALFVLLSASPMQHSFDKMDLGLGKAFTLFLECQNHPLFECRNKSDKTDLKHVSDKIIGFNTRF
jgi:hypothetical protein